MERIFEIIRRTGTNGTSREEPIEAFILPSDEGLFSLGEKGYLSIRPDVNNEGESRLVLRGDILTLSNLDDINRESNKITICLGENGQGEEMLGEKYTLRAHSPTTGEVKELPLGIPVVFGK